jgi:hypothetical protein
MAQMNGMNRSEVLNNEIFGEQPRVCELQKIIDAQLAQLYPESKKSQEVQEVLNRIGSISETLVSLSGETRAEIVSLYAETVATTHLSEYSNKVAILESHQRGRVALVLGASNDEKYSQAA